MNYNILVRVYKGSGIVTLVSGIIFGSLLNISIIPHMDLPSEIA